MYYALYLSGGMVIGAALMGIFGPSVEDHIKAAETRIITAIIAKLDLMTKKVSK